MEEKYTSERVWGILTGRAEDILVEEVTDLQSALSSLSFQHQTLLELLGKGATIGYAMYKANLKGNRTEIRREALKLLVDAMNGGINKDYHCAF